MASKLLMPKATAIWMIDNTALSFAQIADFCGLHILEIQAIADGDNAHGMRGLDPVMMGQLKREEIEKAEKDPNYRMQIKEAKEYKSTSKKRAAKYTPLSKRQDRPNAILWLLRNHGALKDNQIARLLGTTKSTIEQIRNRTHWNSANLVPIDPVALGLCSQVDLNAELEIAYKNLPQDELKDDTLLPAATTEILPFAADNIDEPEIELDNVFARFKQNND